MQAQRESLDVTLTPADSHATQLNRGHEYEKVSDAALAVGILLLERFIPPRIEHIYLTCLFLSMRLWKKPRKRKI